MNGLLTPPGEAQHLVFFRLGEDEIFGSASE
jgi:hypothetical protein